MRDELERRAAILAEEDRKRRTVIERSLDYCKLEGAVMPGGEGLVAALDACIKLLKAVPAS